MGNIRLTTEQFIEKARKIHGDEYDYSKVDYINNHTKVCIVHKKCGNEFWQIPYKHLLGQGCPFCSSTRPKSWDEVLNEFIVVHGDEYNYSKVDFKNMNTKVCIVHKKCGNEFWQTPKNHLRGQGCPFCKSEKITAKLTKSKDDYISEANIVHNFKYDYSKLHYKKANEKVCIICPEHGEFWQCASSHLQGCGCPKCSNEENSIRRKSTTEEFINKAKLVHNDRYIYNKKTIYVSAKTPICIVCPEHGEFWQTPDKHLSGCGCPRCGGTKKYTTKEFINELKKVHGSKYEYSKVKYVDSHTKVCIICPEHGEFWTTPNVLLRGCGCPSCAHKNSKAEKEISQYIKDNTDLLVENNVRGILSNNRELDIYIPEKKIAIEYNGMRWHSEMYNTDKNYHLSKLEECNRLGIKLIQVFEAEYLLNKSIVLDKIIHNLGASNITDKIYARKCVIKEIDMGTAKNFLEKNHIQGFVHSSVYLGCYYNYELVGVMTFKRETNSSDKWELSRFSTDNTKICCGVAGKMFKHFISLYNPSEVKSFADRRWTLDKDDNLYVKLGFTLKETLKPDYRYTKSQTDYLHKFGFRKQKLHKKYGLPLTMTETEMTEELGYYKIWDCGLFKYVWKT